MKVVVIGLGSMGRRRIRLLKALDARHEVCGVDLSADRRRQTAEECDIITYDSLDVAVGQFRPNAAFVCTSPVSHGPIVMECLNAGLHVFTEINLLSDWYANAERLAAEKGLKLFISSTFLYRKEIEYITEAIKGETVDYIYHSGQYLPDWHPWESYKDFFVSNKKTNACREILAIEFPWLIRAFGEIDSIHVMKGRNTSLEIDFDDNYLISIRHKSGNKGVFCQDIIARKGLRRLEVYSENKHLFWEGTPQSLAEYDFETKTLRSIELYKDVEQRAGYNANIIENAYKAEVEDFVAFVEGCSIPRHSFGRDRQILELIDGIENGKYGE